MTDQPATRQFMIFQMPRGFFPIYFIQLFSTMSFAILYSTLVLYMKDKLGMSSQEADIVTGVYFAYNFSLHLLAGFLAGRLFSYRTLIAIGSIFQLIGCLFLAQDSITALYQGLAIMLVGTGTMVTCINMLLSQLFESHDMRREYAFFWNYSGMNIGFVLGFTLAGYFQLSNNYHSLFSISALTNFVSLILLVIWWKSLRDRKTVLSRLTKKGQLRNFTLGLIILAILVPTIYVLLHHTALSDDLILGAGLFMLCLLIVFALQHHGAARKKLFTFIIILLFGQIFWIIYQLAPMVLTLFAKYNVNRHVFGITIAPAWIQNINSFAIIIGGPILAILFKRLRSRSIKISVPFQYGGGLLLAAIGLIILPIGISQASTTGYMAFSWLFITYILQAIAELCIGPVGYSMVGLLGPAKLQSIMMGTVLLNSGVAAVLASFFSNYAVGSTQNTNPLFTNARYSLAFHQLGLAALIASVVLLILAPLISKKLINHSHPEA